MLELPVSDAIGTVLCHDITQIIPGQSKKALFRKGHVIRPEDVEPLRTVGKEHIYVFNLAEGLRREVEAAWGCEIFDHWGMTETGYGGGVECAAHSGYHLREADLLLEIAHPGTGEPLRPGETGEILVTTLGRRALPLVCYRTGDAAAWLAGPCICGSALRRLGRVPGRIASDGTISQPDKGGRTA
ncbi:MAG: hypothetical protein HY916_11145 [Desulfovibrio sp.]|nr:hypothetical protein [Desulfovibrio sp.]